MRTVAEFQSANIPESEFGEPPFDILVPASNPPRCPGRFRPHKPTAATTASCALPIVGRSLCGLAGVVLCANVPDTVVCTGP